MRAVVLRASDGSPIPVQVSPAGDKLLLECREPLRFLDHVSPLRGRSLPPDAWLRGVLIPREGFYFQIRDTFGRVADDVIRLDDDEMKTLMLELA